MNYFTILLVICSIGLYYFIKIRNKGKNRPPGPFQWPLIGNILSLGRNPINGFYWIGEKYGEIASFKMATHNCVFLNDPQLIRKAMNDYDFIGRPDWKLFQWMSGGKIGIIASDGRHWEEQRRFTLRHLRDFGFGKNYMEGLIMDEVKEVIVWLKKQEGQSVTIKGKLGLAGLNALWTIMTGHRYDHDDPKLSHIQSKAVDAILSLSKNPFAIFMDWALDAFPTLTGWGNIQKMVKELNDFFGETIDDHKAHHSADLPPRDFVDSYLNEIDRTTDSKSSFYKENGDKALKAVIGDLFLAGGETTSLTITWAVLYLIVHPEVQRKFHEEIDAVIGKNRLPTLADKFQMPYTEALMQEVLRKSSLIPVATVCATKDTTLNGYFIPKSTFIMINQYFCHQSSKFWGEDVKEFKPERFLSPDGQHYVKNENFMAFSAGKRQCLGENLARDQFFLFLTTIFQKFEISSDPQKPKPSIEPDTGAGVLHPKDYFCIMKERN